MRTREFGLGRTDSEAVRDPVDRLKKNLEQSILAKRRLLGDADCQQIFAAAVNIVVDRYQRGGCMYIAGNGGSAADAQHLAAEFVSKLARDRAPLPAEALTVNSSILTAIGNDYGYDAIFSRQLAARATEGDVFLGITTSGDSRNIVRALEQCRTLRVPSVIFGGRDGGAAKALADYCILVPGSSTSTIQELHIVLAHTLCECVEASLCGEPGEPANDDKDACHTTSW
jgi:D-sedoheptulose 7-phosphate isomerase